MQRMITVPGRPRGKARARVVTQHGKTHAYTPKLQDNYEMCIQANWLVKYGLSTRPLVGPLEMKVIANFKSPKLGACMIRPDADNIIKICADALNSIAYLDDSQIVKVTCDKHYAKEDGVTIIISEWEGEL